MTKGAGEDAAFAVRKRLYEDFPFYGKHALKIRTKTGEILPLTLNSAQKRLWATMKKQKEETGRVRVIVLKARQLGFSTAIGGILYWRVSQNRARKAIVVTHLADSTRTLFDMTKRFHQSVPEILRPSTRYASRRELQFDLLESGYTVATAGGDGIGRGETITDAHLSELAFWPRGSASDNFNGLLQAVPNADGTSIFIESTANGVSGLFYQSWKAAESGENEFIPFFAPWFEAEEYRERVPEGFERSPEEKDLARRFGLDDEQLVFRRKKVALFGAEHFRQEYPATADEAFLTTGRPVFNPDLILEMRRKAKPVVARLALNGETWDKNPLGELKCYAGHNPNATYIIGADPGLGVQRDWSVAQVLNSSGEQVAVWRGQADPDYFATVLYHLGRFYNDATVIVESNSHGILTCTRLGKDMAYPAFYTETVFDKITDAETTKLGFTTSSKSKPLVIDKLRASIRDGNVIVNDATTLDEMQSYIVTESGGMEAEAGCHDDCVMSLALANHISDAGWAPIQNQPNWYVEGF